MKKSYFSFFLVITSIVLFWQSCTPKIDRQAEIQSLIDADKSFSRLSSESGSNNAFLHFIDSAAVLLRDNSTPLKGVDSIRKYLLMNPDSGYKLVWEPQFAEVSASGDFGYTYGIYDILLPDEQGRYISRQKGTYVTIWKKNDDGVWKWVLDSGNEGLGDK